MSTSCVRPVGRAVFMGRSLIRGRLGVPDSRSSVLRKLEHFQRDSSENELNARQLDSPGF